MSSNDISSEPDSSSSSDESFNGLSCNNSLYEFHDVDNDKSISTTNKNIIAFLNTSKNTYYTQEQTIAFSFDHEKKEKKMCLGIKQLLVLLVFDLLILS